MARQHVIILIVLALTINLKSKGQSVDSTNRKKTIITLDCSPKMNYGEALFIISINHLQADLTINELTRDSINFNPDWIKSLNVLKGQEITEYGERGKFGVILIELKSEIFDQLSTDLKAKFKVKD